MVLSLSLVLLLIWSQVKMLPCVLIYGIEGISNKLETSLRKISAFEVNFFWLQILGQGMHLLGIQARLF